MKNSDKILKIVSVGSILLSMPITPVRAEEAETELDSQVVVENTENVEDEIWEDNQEELPSEDTSEFEDEIIENESENDGTELESSADFEEEGTEEEDISTFSLNIPSKVVAKGNYGTDWYVSEDGVLYIEAGDFTPPNMPWVNIASYYKRGGIQVIPANGETKLKLHGTMKQFFCGYNFSKVDLSQFDISDITDMTEAFYGIEGQPDFSTWDTSHVTNMTRMFMNSGAYSSNEKDYLDLTGLDTSSVVNMQSFLESSQYSDVNLSGLDTTNVTNMRYFFSGCTNLENIDVSGFDTSTVTDMGCMFESCISLKQLDLSNFNTSNVLNMQGMFRYCYELTELDLSNFDTTSVFYGTMPNYNSSGGFAQMFTQCTKLETLNLSGFKLGNQKNDLWKMFADCTSLRSLDLSGLNTEKIIDAGWLDDWFLNCTSLVEIKLGNNYFSTTLDPNVLMPGGADATWINLETTPQMGPWSPTAMQATGPKTRLDGGRKRVLPITIN